MKKILKTTLTLVFLFFMVSCGETTTVSSTTTNETTEITTTETTTTTESPETTEELSFEGTYVLYEKSIGSVNTSSQYLFNVLILDEDLNAIIKYVDIYGLDIEAGTYINTENGVEVTFGFKTYTYIYNQETEFLTYEGTINRLDALIIYQKDDQFFEGDTTGSVSFYDELFGESSDEDFYNYCPSIMMEGNNIMHIWYCSNKESGIITDYIAYRKGTLSSDGLWTFTEKQLVLEPTEGTWDEVHTCDPSVVKGVFNYNEEEYYYLMAYLGCVSYNNASNEVGIAVAKNPEGPYIKIDEINPIANYYDSPEYTDQVWTWGYGQPSLVSVDKAGQVLLFYTKGVVNGTYTQVEYLDLSDLNNPIRISSERVSNLGVVNASGISDVINNASFAYDAYNNRLYVIKEDFPYTNHDGFDWITSSNTLMYLDLNDLDEFVGETLFVGTNLKWVTVESITQNSTGYYKNHNCGLITDEYGWIINPYEIPLIYTVSDLIENLEEWEDEGIWSILDSYRLYGYKIEID